MNGEECSSALNSTFETLGLILRNSHAYERSYDSADCASNAKTGERTHDWTGSNQRANTRNRESTNTGEQSESATDNPSSGHASSGTLRGLGVFLMSERTSAFIIGQENGYGGVRETNGK
jgi:hypothetical protein